MRALSHLLAVLGIAFALPCGAQERESALAECRRIRDLAAAGELPPGSEQWGLTREAFRAALSTISDPAVPLQDLETAVMRSLLIATPSLADPLLVQPLTTGRPYVLDEALPKLVAVEGAVLLFRCTIRDYGGGWNPATLMVGRKDSGAWVKFPLTSPQETL